MKFSAQSCCTCRLRRGKQEQPLFQINNKKVAIDKQLRLEFSQGQLHYPFENIILGSWAQLQKEETCNFWNDCEYHYMEITANKEIEQHFEFSHPHKHLFNAIVRWEFKKRTEISLSSPLRCLLKGVFDVVPRFVCLCDEEDVLYNDDMLS